jgi:transposase-like protein
MGPIDLDIPRDRKWEFEPKLVKKNQTDISDIEDGCQPSRFNRHR